tara:strand:- start:250 stop:552 length:303 start_codon:yes stop_codon:yes gene_type:complete
MKALYDGSVGRSYLIQITPSELSQVVISPLKAKITSTDREGLGNREEVIVSYSPRSDPEVVEEEKSLIVVLGERAIDSLVEEELPLKLLGGRVIVEIDEE